MLGLTAGQWFLFALSALLMGLNKSGLFGVAMLTIPISAAVFGARESVGILLPLFVAGDIFAVLYFRRHAQWSIVLRLLPWAVIGIVAGTIVGGRISDLVFRRLIAGLVLVSVALLAYQEVSGRELPLSRSRLVSPILGALAGFASMVGNAASPVISLYFLATGLPKNQFIGTAAWFQFAINLVKIPFHIFFWHTVTGETLLLDSFVVPIVFAGAALGILVVKRMPERPYRIFVLASTVLVTLRLIF